MNIDSSIPGSQLGSSISESLLPSQRVVRRRALLSSGLLLLAVSIPSHLIIYSSVDRTYSTNMLIGNLTVPDVTTLFVGEHAKHLGP
ncbi:hypothetical protein PVAP13_9NG551384 [Panicum virgatum]|uniref:Uncharacterized protein n=1 Tax=Panicum virgatum TaxID=38727 RepID=A0A8T0MUI8_PANVG|nr:hypothetical protein PVAP13_9NG551384 [Panicum virgatum]